MHYNGKKIFNSFWRFIFTKLMLIKVELFALPRMPLIFFNFDYVLAMTPSIYFVDAPITVIMCVRLYSFGITGVCVEAQNKGYIII